MENKIKHLEEYKEELHSCSKCGLCQAVCPIYKITGNDCTVSRGQFIMLQGLIKGDLKLGKKLHRYLDLCLKCSACSKFCPSGIDVVDIIAAAKHEYFVKNPIEKLSSFIQKHLIFNFILNIFAIFVRKKQSKNFDKKVIFYGGCGSKIRGNSSVIKILNSCGIEVISPDFKCCGMPFYVRGDFDTYSEYMKNFTDTVRKYEIKDVVTTCASCEKVLKDYSKWTDLGDIKIHNIFEYIRENNLQFELKQQTKITFHKPCNMNNYDDILWCFNNTKNLEYIEMKDYNKCCGLNGIGKLSEYKIFKNLFKEKHNNIVSTGTKCVLTSCMGCEAVLKLFSKGKYAVEDITGFLAKNIK